MPATPPAVTSSVLVVAALAAAVAPGPQPPAAAAASVRSRPPHASHRPPPPRPGWSRPFRIAAPVALDLLPPQIGFAPSGAAAIAFGVHDVDAPEVSTGFAALRSPGGRLARPARVPGARTILDLGFGRSDFDLLTGSSATRALCCTSADVTALTAGGAFGRGQAVARHLTGTVAGRLLTLTGGRVLAAIASGSGVSVAQSSPGARFSAPQLLTPGGSQPQALAATVLDGDRSVVAWTAGGTSSGVGPRRIFVATGSRSRPRRGRAAITVPGRHGVNELGLVARGSVATVAWIESSHERTGRYRSLAVVADLDRKPRALAFELGGEDASGLSIAAGTSGDQVLAWKACAAKSDRCTVRVASGSAGGRFGAPLALGAIDATQAPAVAVAANGEALAGWIRHGRVLASERRSATTGFGSPRAISRGGYAADLALAFGPKGEAIAAWTQGTLFPDLLGATYRAA